MTQTKIEGKFYPLTSEISQKLRKANLTAAEWRLWSYLVELDPFGDHYQDLPDALTIMAECNIKKTTFYKAIAKFQELELFDFQDKGFNFRNLSCPFLRKTFRENGKLSAKTENFPQKRKTFRENGKLSEKTENQTPESSPVKASEADQTIQTYSNFKQTLSEPEREKFLNFVRGKIKHFPNPINDLEGWLAKKNEAGIYRWRVYYEVFQREVYNQKEPIGVIDWQKHPKYDEWIKHVASCPLGFSYQDQQEGLGGVTIVFGTPEDRAERKAFANWAMTNQHLWRNK